MARRVLITGARAACALDLARDFAAAGWAVHLADCVTVRMARWSRVAAQHHRYPAPRRDAAAFRQGISRLVEDHKIDLPVPTCEEVFHLAAPSLAAQLGTRLFAPPLATLRGLHDKLAFARQCHAWGPPVPESHALNQPGALARFAATSQQWVFKPRFSRFGDRALIGPQAAQLGTIQQGPDNLWMAQRLVGGQEACFYAVAHHGALVAFAAYRSDWRLGGGASFAFAPLGKEQEAQLRALADGVARQAGIHGQFAADVMVDPSGQPWLLECNPRATSGVHLLAGNGDLARAIGDGAPMAEARPGSAYLAPALWLFGLRQALRQGRLAEWQALRRSGRDVISRPGDAMPVLGALADAAQFGLTALRRGISTTAATTCDIEWNGEDLT